MIPTPDRYKGSQAKCRFLRPDALKILREVLKEITELAPSLKGAEKKQVIIIMRASVTNVFLR